MKSAVIVRSIHEFLARNTQPSSFQIYEEVMREAAEQRPHRILVRDAIRQKHAERSASAAKASKAK